jgi:hypothetical protein
MGSHPIKLLCPACPANAAIGIICEDARTRIEVYYEDSARLGFYGTGHGPEIPENTFPRLDFKILNLPI